VFAERFDGLVYGETRNIGGDLEQDAAGLTVVDRPGVVAVLLLCRMLTVGLHQLARHLGLVGVAHGAERDVMNRTSALPARQETLGLVDRRVSILRLSVRLCWVIAKPGALTGSQVLDNWTFFRFRSICSSKALFFIAQRHMAAIGS
jgi:hypothetical protein